MTIRRVLLPLVGTDLSEPLAACAFLIGRLHQAQVQALVLQRQLLGVEFGDPPEGGDLLADLVAEAREESEKTLSVLATPYQPFELEVSVASGDIGRVVAHAARLSDIAIVGAGARYGEGQWRDIRDAVLFQSGRPVIVAPRAGLEASAFDRVIIAWKESIEAARAVAAAQPFLRQARELHILAAGESDAGAASLRDVEQYLQLHYSEVRSEAIPQDLRKDVADILLDRAQALGGALLVMGAYSHWRWREQVFGGVTEAMLAQARSPVLMAH
jgi:nucleotide-binding universal stress UspA family protein